MLRLQSESATMTEFSITIRQASTAQSYIRRLGVDAQRTGIFSSAQPSQRILELTLEDAALHLKQSDTGGNLAHRAWKLNSRSS